MGKKKSRKTTVGASQIHKTTEHKPRQLQIARKGKACREFSGRREYGKNEGREKRRARRGPDLRVQCCNESETTRGLRALQEWPFKE